jgi:Outer membrane protein beta-barrel domain
MKKYYLLPVSLLSILFVLTSNAQNQKNYLGIKGGISIPNLTANGSEQNPINTGYSSRLGPDFAVFFEREVTKTFSFMPSIEFSSQGGKKNGFQAFTTPDAYAGLFPPGQVPPYLYADYNSEAKMNYLMLNVLAKFNWMLGSKSQCSIYLDAGPFGALLVSAHQVTSGSSEIYADEQMQQPISPGPQSFDNKQDIKSDLHKGNFGVEGDLGIALNFGMGKIFLEGGGNYGFLNIQKGSENGKNQTGAATVRAGYAYSFGK